MIRSILQPFDEGQGLATQTRHDAESIAVLFTEDNREVLIEQTNGEIRVRCYDGSRDAPLTVVIPENPAERMAVELGDYGKE